MCVCAHVWHAIRLRKVYLCVGFELFQNVFTNQRFLGDEFGRSVLCCEAAEDIQECGKGAVRGVLGGSWFLQYIWSTG